MQTQQSPAHHNTNHHDLESNSIRQSLASKEVNIKIYLHNVIRELEAKKAINGVNMPYGAVSGTLLVK